MRVFVKRPDEQVSVEFDASSFINSQPADSTSLVFRADPGITVDGELDSETGLVTVTATGGDVGGLYRFGFEIRSATGAVLKVVNDLLRVRDMTRWEDVPVVETIGGGDSGNFIFLVNEAGELLLSADGEALYVIA